MRATRVGGSCESSALGIIPVLPGIFVVFGFGPLSGEFRLAMFSCACARLSGLNRNNKPARPRNPASIRLPVNLKFIALSPEKRPRAGAGSKSHQLYDAGRPSEGY